MNTLYSLSSPVIHGENKPARDEKYDSASCKVSPANLLEGFGVPTVFVPQLSIMHIVDFNEI